MFCLCFRVEGFEFRVWDIWERFQVLGLRVLSLGFRVRVQKLRYMV
jgi:hypothetical protein